MCCCLRRAFPVGLGGASAPGRRPLVQTLQDWASFQHGPSGDQGEPICPAARAAAPHTGLPPRKPVPAWGGAWDAGLRTALGGAARGEHDLAACARTGWRKTQLKSCFVVCFCFLFLKILVTSRWWPNCENFMMLVFLRVFSPMFSLLCSGILTMISLRIAGGGQKGLALGSLGELRPSPSLLSPGARHTELT